jgi:dipeptidyl aminopeptidase/acylaminoacyl peptidase
VAAVSLSEPDSHPQVLVSGNDFYGPVRISPDGNQIAWLTWNHPNMPWDGTELWLGEFSTDGSIVNSRVVAGGEKESILQPEWSPDGQLYFVSDRTGWWNIYRLTAELSVESVTEIEGEFGTPQWAFGFSNYAFANSELIACSYIQSGFSKLAVINVRTREIRTVDSPYTDISYIRAEAGRAVFRAGSPTQPPGIVLWDIETNNFEVLRRSNSLEIPDAFFSPAQAIEFPTEGGLIAHGFYYPPKNPDYVGPDDQLPPLLVRSHGGPTSAAVSALNLNIQFWTSRGIAVLDVNYGGSSGFGREYRDRLKDSWGVVDVDDCANGARYLVKRGAVDGNRLMITGGSAGGYTTLCALTFRDVFKAGASHYGVSDAEALAKETHKFESRYLDGLFGPYPEQREVYRARSPINFTDQLSCPVIFFQGLEDKVVPPNQAEMMVNALKEKGIPVAYVSFEGEQHGFRQAQNIKRALEGELYFYSQVFGFELAEPVEPVKIENL